MSGPFALVDCNNFYVSCERLFAPALEGRPVVVLSNNDGCVIARSEEAKALGIAMGAPVFEAAPVFRRHRVRVFSSNYALYGDMSQRVMALLGEFSPEVEVYSIDEAFLGLSGFAGLDWSAYGHRLRNRVRRCTGIPISVGIAPTKTLAKLANRIAKKEGDGVLDLIPAGRRRRALAATDVGEVWGIGRRSREMLRANAIRTALDFHDAPEWWVRRRMGVVGARTLLELRGVPCLGLESQPAGRKSAVVSRSFRWPLEDRRQLREAVAVFAGRAAEKLRQGGLVAGALTVFVDTNRLNPRQRQHHDAVTVCLAVPTGHGGAIAKAAARGLEGIFRPGYRYKKAGVLLHEVSPAEGFQPTLFEGAGDVRADRLMETIDDINRRLGPGLVHYGSSGVRPGWRTTQDHRSPRYTTRWQDLLGVGD